MGRPSSFTEEEDAILLATAGCSSDETNERLVAAGFEARRPQALKSRRHKLRAQGNLPDVATDADLPQLLELRTALHSRRAALQSDIDAVDEALTNLAMRIKAKLTELDEEVGLDLSEPADTAR